MCSLEQGKLADLSKKWPTFRYCANLDERLIFFKKLIYLNFNIRKITNWCRPTFFLSPNQDMLPKKSLRLALSCNIMLTFSFTLNILVFLKNGHILLNMNKVLQSSDSISLTYMYTIPSIICLIRLMNVHWTKRDRPHVHVYLCNLTKSRWP